MRNTNPEILRDHVLVWLWRILLVVAIGSIIVIAIHENLSIDLTSSGFSQFLSIFDFPIKSAAASIAVLTIRLAWSSIDRAVLGNSLARHSTRLSAFLDYAGDQGMLVVDGSSTDSVPPVQYSYPIVTFNRVLELENTQFVVSSGLQEKIDKVFEHYENMCAALNKVNEYWLIALADLQKETRDLRADFLCIRTDACKRFSINAALQIGEPGPRRRIIGINGSNMGNLLLTVWLELLYIYRVLFFFPELAVESSRLLIVAEGVEALRRDYGISDRPISSVERVRGIAVIAKSVQLPLWSS